MGLSQSVYGYKDKYASMAEKFILAYFVLEVVWLIIWSGTILALELTTQIGFDADSKYELQSTIGALHAIATAGLLFYFRGENTWLVYLSLFPVLITDTTSVLHLAYQVPEASWWAWALCMVIAGFGLFLDVYAIICVIIMKDIMKIRFEPQTEPPIDGDEIELGEVRKGGVALDDVARALLPRKRNVKK